MPYRNPRSQAVDINITDAGGYFTGTEVETALQELGASGAGDVSKVGTPVDNQVGVWTGDGTIEGTTGLTYDGSNLHVTGDIGITGTRIAKGWFTDLEVTNAIAGSITGNAGTVSTITGLAPDTQNTYARTQFLIPYADTTTSFGEIAIGAATEVLTSNGAGLAPTFQAAGGGGGGLTGTTIKTIGSSGDYADFGAFIADNSSPYHCVFTSNVTEDSDVVVDGTVVIDLDRYTWTVPNYQLTSAGTIQLVITGAGRDSGAEIDWTPTAWKKFMYAVTSTGSSIEMSGFKFDSNTNAGYGYICDDGIQNIHDMTLDLPDESTCGFYATEHGCVYQNIICIGGGTNNAETPIRLSADNAIVDNIYYKGSWKVGGNMIESGGSDCQISNINAVEVAQETNLNFLGPQVTASNIQGRFNMVLDNSIEAQLSNIDLLQGDFDIGTSDRVSATNITNVGLFDLSDAGASNGAFTNISVGITNLTVAGDFHKFTNIVGTNDVTVLSGADDNGFVNCKFDLITIDSGANRTRVGFCTSDAAIVDNGTGSELGFNSIY